jgi:hypothetical protein
MVVHESHPVALPIDPLDPASEGGYEFLEERKQNTGDDGPLRVASRPFGEVETRKTARQPEDRDLGGMGLEPSLDGVGVMKPAVVADLPSFAPGTRGEPGDQKR